MKQELLTKLTFFLLKLFNNILFTHYSHFNVDNQCIASVSIDNFFETKKMLM